MLLFVGCLIGLKLKLEELSLVEGEEDSSDWEIVGLLWSPFLFIVYENINSLYFFIYAIMEKKLAVISSAYARTDVDWTVLWFTVWVKEKDSKSDYTYRFDFWLESFKKTFWLNDDAIKNPERLNDLKGKDCYIIRTLSLK